MEIPFLAKGAMNHEIFLRNIEFVVVVAAVVVVGVTV